MTKPRGTEAKLTRLCALAREPVTASSMAELTTFLRDRSNLVVAEAAEIAGKARIAELAPELVAAFDRLMVEPEQSDKLCRGKIAIVEALDQLEYSQAEVFLRGIRHVQFEAGWGEPTDVAAPLRGHCAFALVRLNYKGVVLLLADLLADSEKAARVAAAQALGGTGAVAAIPLLRFKVRAGDPEPEVISACFSALIGLDPDDSIPFVAEFLERPDEAMQEAAALALGESRQAAALAPLKSFCEQAPAGSLQEVAFLSLAMLRLPAAIDSLLEVVSQQNQDSASAAISALAIYRHNPSIRERAEAAVSRNGNDAVRKWFDKKFATKD